MALWVISFCLSWLADVFVDNMVLQYCESCGEVNRTEIDVRREEKGHLGL